MDYIHNNPVSGKSQFASTADVHRFSSYNFYNHEVAAMYFSNTATTYHTEEQPQEKFFFSSHGGIGGSFVPGEYDRGITAMCRAGRSPVPK